VTQAQTLITAVQDEMQTYHDQRSERWQESDRADDIRDRIDSLSDIEQALTEWLTL
jgi:FixJ family two-component response regulator